MKTVLTSLALAVLCTSNLLAQTAINRSAPVDQGEGHCLAQADEQTWSTLGLNDDQIRKVKEIQTRYKLDEKMDHGTENTQRGTGDDAATPTTGATGTSNTDEPRMSTATSTDRDPGATGTDRAGSVTTDPTKADPHGTGTPIGRPTDQLGYDHTKKEAMERELRTVLTTAQYESYQAWCHDQDNSRGDRNMDMDR